MKDIKKYLIIGAIALVAVAAARFVGAMNVPVASPTMRRLVGPSS